MACPQSHISLRGSAWSAVNINDSGQKKMVEMLVNGEELTSRMCEGIYGITRDTASRDFKKLISSEIATKIGSGRSTRYVLKVKS